VTVLLSFARGSGVSLFSRDRAIPLVLRKAAEHAKERGAREVAQELIQRVKANIRNAKLKMPHRIDPALPSHFHISSLDNLGTH
jgi:hypothetical protein